MQSYGAWKQKYGFLFPFIKYIYDVYADLFQMQLTGMWIF